MISTTRFLFFCFLFSSHFCFGMDSSSDDLAIFDDLALDDDSDRDVQMEDADSNVVEPGRLHAVCYDANNALIELRRAGDNNMQLWREGKPVSAPFAHRATPLCGESLACLDNGNIAVRAQDDCVFAQTGEQFEERVNFGTVDAVCSHNGALYGVTKEGNVSTWRSGNDIQRTNEGIFSRGFPHVYGHSCWQGQLPFVVWDSDKVCSTVFLVNLETQQKRFIYSSGPNHEIEGAYIIPRGLLFSVHGGCVSLHDVQANKEIAIADACGTSQEECTMTLYPPKNMSLYWALIKHTFATREAQLWDLRRMKEPVCRRRMFNHFTRTGDLSSDGNRLTYVGLPWEDPCTIDFSSSYFANEHDSTTVLAALGKRELGNRK